METSQKAANNALSIHDECREPRLPEKLVFRYIIAELDTNGFSGHNRPSL